MKLSKRKREIRSIGYIFMLLATLALISLGSQHLYSPVEERSVSFVSYIGPGILLVLYFLAAFALRSFRKWARMLGIIASVTLFFISLEFAYGIISNKALSLWPLGALVFLIVMALLFISLSVYSFLILLHKDAKLIFKYEGNLEGSEEE